MPDYAEVIIDLVSYGVDRPFHYRIPSELRGLLSPGMRVNVPFGRRSYQGYVLRLLEHTPVDNLKDITTVNDPEPVLTVEQIALAHWMSLHFYSRKIDALHAMVPASFRKGNRPGKINMVEAVPGAGEENLERAPAQKKALEIIREQKVVPKNRLGALGITAQVIKALEEKGLVQTVIADRPVADKPQQGELTEPHLLREEQRICFNEVREALNENRPKHILLHGITASGKTEIYLQSIAHCLEQGRTAMILVPEISLTPQMINHFAGRFPGRVAVLHSRLTTAEKNRQWQMILTGRARVVLGARSAVFAPLEAIGLIIIDEEHENTYKQEETPRYHARDIAWWRARYHKGVLLLGSATPALESYYRAREGDTVLLSMKERVTPIQLPPVNIVDMRQELKEKHRHIFSRPLLEELNGVIERDEQALLFINRRGFAGFVLCRECGHVVRCPSCDVSMTLHMDRQIMCCHYCAHEASIPLTCPGCRGTKIRYFSAGTQRVEDEVKKLYPDVSLIRMDRDTTASRKAHSHFYRQFSEKKANILIGTQMIAKGFDFPGVTLVGVIAADTTLNLPDFRSPERTFQLLTQVAGRTARGPGGGKVIVQTYRPNHHSILSAKEHDYLGFYEAELENRRQLAYPPFSEFLRFLFSGGDEEAVFNAASWFTEKIIPLAGEAEVLGPAPASLYRIKEQYRVHSLLKGNNLVKLAPKIKKVIREYHGRKGPEAVRLAVDFNPQSVL
ncbi:MAG: primosomal protein N' [Bacillota bacterium]